MPDKQQNTKSERYVSRHERSKWQKQKMMQRIILAAGVAVLVAVVAILGTGLYNSQVKPYTRPAIKVNDVTFDMRYYINMLAIYRAYAQGAIGDEYLPDYVKQQIEQQELLIQGAAALGIKVDRSTAEADLKKAGSSVTPERIDLMMVNNVIKKLQDEYFKPKIPATQPQVNAMAMLLEDESSAQTVMRRLNSGEDFATVASDISLDPTTKYVKGDLGWNTQHLAEKSMGSATLADALFKAQVGSVSGPTYDDSVTKDLGFWVMKVLEKQGEADSQDNPEKVHVLGILVGSQADAQKVKERLSAGEDFATVAKELSLDDYSKDLGGDRGFISRQQESKEIEDAIFGANNGDLIGPLRDTQTTTKGGYWVVKLVEKDDNKQLSDDQFGALVNEQMDEWAQGLSTASGNKVDDSFLDQDAKAFALREAIAIMSKSSGQ